MDILAEILTRVRLSGTLLYHYELSCPWGLVLPGLPYGVFHYLSSGSASLQVQKGKELLAMSEGDFVLVSHGEPHVLRSDRKAKPFPLLELHRPPAHLGVVRHGGGQKPFSTMICGYFSLQRPSRNNVLEMLPPVLHLKSASNRDWLDTILRRMVDESALALPGQQAVLSRMTEVLFVEVLRSWIESLRPGEGGWLRALGDSHVGKALQLIHEQPNQAWTLREVGRRVGLGRSAFAARFTELVGQPMNRYLIAHRMELAAALLERSDDPMAEIASRVGYETTSAFSKLFRRHHRIPPGRFRAARKEALKSDGAVPSPL